MTRRSISLTLAGFALALTFVSCGGDEAKATADTAATNTSTQAPPLPAELQDIASATESATDTAAAAAAQATSANEFAATGEFISPVRSELAPKIGGRVARMFVDEGSIVRRGQPVLQLETDYVRLNLQSAQAELARAKAARDEAARDLQRKSELVAKGSIPRATFDRSQAMADQTNASVAAASAQVALFQQQMGDSTLRSPVDGIIAEKRTDLGARLGDGGIAFVVVQLSPLKLRFQVPERYLGRIRIGDRVTARVDPYPNETFEGTIKTVGGVINPATRTMFAEAEFANRDGRLRPGLFARVEAKLQ